MATFNELLAQNTVVINELIDAVNALISEGGGSGSEGDATSVNGIDIGDLSGITDGDLLVYDENESALVPLSIFGDLSGIAEGNILKWQDGELVPASVELGEITGFPSDFSGQGGKALVVNEGEDGLTFATLSSSGGGYQVTDAFKLFSSSVVSYTAGITRIVGGDTPISLVGANLTTDPALESTTLDDDSFGYTTGSNPPIPHWVELTFPEPVTLGRFGFSHTMTRANLVNGGAITSFDLEDRTAGVTTLTSVSSGVWPGSTSVSSTTTRRIYFSLGTSHTDVEVLRFVVNSRYTGGASEAEPFPVTVSDFVLYEELIPSSERVTGITGALTLGKDSILFDMTSFDGLLYVPSGFLKEQDGVIVADTATNNKIGGFPTPQELLSLQKDYVIDTVGLFFDYDPKVTVNRAYVLPVLTNRLYIGVNSLIYIHNRTAGSLIETLDLTPLQNLTGLAYSPSQNKVFASSESGHIAVIDSDNEIVSTVLSSSDNGNITGVLSGIAVSESQGRVYVSVEGANEVLVLASGSNSYLTKFSVGDSPTRITVSDGINRGIVCNTAGGTITVFDTTNNTVVNTVPMAEIGGGSEPSAAVIDTSGATPRGLVTLKGFNQVAVVDLDTFQVTGRIATSTNPIAIEFVPSANAYYVAGEDGEVTVVNPVS